MICVNRGKLVDKFDYYMSQNFKPKTLNFKQAPFFLERGQAQFAIPHSSIRNRHVSAPTPKLFSI